MRDVDRLSDYLIELEQSGWTFEEYLAAHPELPDNLVQTVRAASWVRAAPLPLVSATFRRQARSRFVTSIQQNVLRNRQRHWWQRYLAELRQIARPVLVPLAAMLIAVGAGGAVWSSASSALPELPFYGAKVAFERLEVLSAFSARQQVAIHLSLAQLRLDEANAEIRVGNRDSVDGLIRAFDREVADARDIIQAPANGVTAEYQSVAESDITALQATRNRVVGPIVAQVNPAQPVPSTDRTAATLPPVTIVVPTVAPAPALVETVSTVPQSAPITVVVADASNDGLNRALAMALGTGTWAPGFTMPNLKVVTAVQSIVSSPSAIVPAAVVTNPAPVPVVLPVTGPTVPAGNPPPTVPPVAIPPRPRSGGSPPPAAPPSNGDTRNPAPPPSMPIGNPIITIPTIVHDPTHLPSPALTGHKPVVSPARVAPAPVARIP